MVEAIRATTEVSGIIDCNDVTLASWRLRWLVNELFVQQISHANNKENTKASHYWTLDMGLLIIQRFDLTWGKRFIFMSSSYIGTCKGPPVSAVNQPLVSDTSCSTTGTKYMFPWWRHGMETLPAIYFVRGIRQTAVVSPTKGQQLGDLIFIVASLNKILKYQSSCKYFETAWCSCDIIMMIHGQVGGTDGTVPKASSKR